MNFNKLSPLWKNVISYTAVALVSAAIAFALGTSTAPQINYSSSGTIISSKDKLGMLQEVIKKNYIGEVNQETLVDAAAKAMVEALGDEWSFYMNPTEYIVYQQDLQNQYQGIGITVKTEKVGGGFLISALETGGGGEQAGLQLGDIITHVEGKSLVDLDHNQTKNLIRGKYGTRVELTIVRGEETFQVLVTRGSVAIQVAKAQMLDNDIGLVTIANFDERCATETKAAVESLQNQGAKALIFDVRGNPGGYKREMVDVLDYLLPEGTLFISESTDGEKTEDTSDENCLKLPMAVLVNKDSYSAAEFFAAALEEYDWAVTVGEQTTGKGYFQSDIKLDDGSAIHLSIGKYFTPKGVSLAEAGGITPNIEVALEEAQTELLAAGELAPEDDAQVQAAIDALADKLN